MAKRVFILGAGFSCGAQMPDAVGLTKLLIEEAIGSNGHRELRDYVDYVSSLLNWTAEEGSSGTQIEEFFELARLDAERWRYRQHRYADGRYAGTPPWPQSQTIEFWLGYLQDYVAQCIWKKQADCVAHTGYVSQFTEQLSSRDDTIISFNYDTLVEDALNKRGTPWQYGLPNEGRDGLLILKMHGSINWGIWPRDTSLTDCAKLLYKKEDRVADELGRQPPPEEREYWNILAQILPRQEIHRTAPVVRALNREIALAGIGPHKRIHETPGLGWVWDRAAQALFDAEEITAIGFSLATFDGLARLVFADVMKQRSEKSISPPRLRIIDMNAAELRQVYLAIFHCTPMLIEDRVENIDWDTVFSDSIE